MWTKLDGDLVVYDVLENGLRVRVSPEGDHVYGTLVQSAESRERPVDQLGRQGDTQLCGEHAGADGTPRAGSGLDVYKRQFQSCRRIAALHGRLAAALRLRLHNGKRFVLFLSVCHI